MWALLDRFGWLLAIVFVVIGFAVCYSQYRAVHGAQERHYASAVTERHEQISLDREIVGFLKAGHDGR